MSATSRIPSQAETLAWVAAWWPDRTDPIWRAAKLGEEAGEVLGAVIKMDEGRKTITDLSMETAQVVLCAMALAESAGFDLLDAIEAEWRRIGDRPAAPSTPNPEPDRARGVTDADED